MLDNLLDLNLILHRHEHNDSFKNVTCFLSQKTKHKNMPNKTFGKRKETLESKISKEIERNVKQFGTAVN